MRSGARNTTVALLWTLVFNGVIHAQGVESPEGERSDKASAYHQWENGPASDPGYFPIAVWLQSPGNAERYKAAGINLYVGLWKGPTAAQLVDLKKAGMPVICSQNEVGLIHADRDIIVGWMHGDEPDNAQSLGKGKGYGPPVAPEKVVRDYQQLKRRDPSRPILLNLGQGVAWDGWRGRGTRTNHPEDYPRYIKGCDIASFDIYPAVHSHPEVAGKLEFVPRGVDRLREWSGDEEKIVWNCIECTRISNVATHPTPDQVRAEIWMSLIHGSRGLIYFVHQFKPRFNEKALLDNPEMLKAVTSINRQIRGLAPVLNSPSVEGEVVARSSRDEVPIDIMVKRHEGATYVFAVCMRDVPVTASFEFKTARASGPVTVLGEARTLPVTEDTFRDEFKGYGVHLYRIPASSK